MNTDETFGKLDKNTDGGIDVAEFTEPQKNEIEGRFKMMDANTDGKITKDELKTAAEKMRSMMGGRGGQGGPGGQGMRPGGQGGPGGPGGGGEGGFRRPPSEEGGTGRPRPEGEGEAPKKDTGV